MTPLWIGIAALLLPVVLLHFSLSAATAQWLKTSGLTVISIQPRLRTLQLLQLI